MASTERLVRAEEDITAISHTVLDIQETVDAHTRTLDAHSRDLADIKGTLTTITSTLDEILTAIRPATELSRDLRRRPLAKSERLDYPMQPDEIGLAADAGVRAQQHWHRTKRPGAE